MLGIEVNTALPDVAEALFRLDLGAKVLILRTPPGGGARLDQSAWVQKIAISGEAGNPVWRVALGVSPL